MKRFALFITLAATTVLLAQEAVRQDPFLQQQAVTNRIVPKAALAAPSQPATLRRIADKISIAAPLQHANIEIFFIEGDDLADTTKVLTLDEAMSVKAGVVVKETKQVNELSVQNGLADKQVFIMAGDIVKGGQQDRTLASDLPLQPQSGSVPVASFCVEQGRWQKRGNESADAFASSKNAITSKEGKLAVRKAANQSLVWDSVAAAQEKLSRNIGKDVKPVASASSLQLTLEDKDLKAKVAAFQKALLAAVEARPRSLGFVYAINGEINSAEIIAGHDLFRRLWPKMLESIATEAISLADGKKAATPATVESVLEFIRKAESAAATKKPLQGTLKHISAESDETCLFETADEKLDGQWLRRNILKKDR
ncbi:MAG: hypothetical protein JNG86_14565 [Verrucomicrobiaceae bacterium]|nr:hypothetical protein [Verrucomicrobiaceae bacterium]